jgi:hypothetical protein
LALIVVLAHQTLKLWQCVHLGALLLRLEHFSSTALKIMPMRNATGLQSVNHAVIGDQAFPVQ